MSKHQKLDAICLIESSGLSTCAALKRLGIARSTYYRWKKKFQAMGLKGLQDNKPHRLRTWNQLLANAIMKALAMSRPMMCTSAGGMQPGKSEPN